MKIVDSFLENKDQTNKNLDNLNSAIDIYEKTLQVEEKKLDLIWIFAHKHLEGNERLSDYSRVVNIVKSMKNDIDKKKAMVNDLKTIVG